MYTSVEKREASLKKMLATFVKDKEKIEETVAELDRYKREALESTWKKIGASQENTIWLFGPHTCYSDFGGIFAELLPGNFAKLQPPEDQDLMDGLKSKCGLGAYGSRV